MLLARIYLALSGLLLAGYGVYCLINPMVLGDLTGLVIATPTALIEIRAMYGGLELALGVYFIFSAILPETTRQGLFCLFLCLGSLAIARAAGLFADGGDNGYNAGALVYESVSAVLALVALLLLRSGQLRKQS